MPSADDHESPFVDEPARPLPPAPAAPPWTVAIVDDEEEVHAVTRLALQDVVLANRKLAFVSARSAAEARALFAEKRDIAVVLLDVVMETDDAGLALVRYIREELADESVRVVLRTGQPGQAPEATVIRNYDISDYRTKTELTSTRLLTTVISALRTYEQLRAVKAAYDEIARLTAALERERDYLREEVKESGGAMIGASPALDQVRTAIAAVASTDATVLVLGESGVGKELVARAIHEASGRASGPLVKVNCASVPRELFESEFFGHVRGAFTGAHKDRVGRFQLADGGTLFLDEVGEIPLELQGKLLRALQEREVERIGDGRAQKVDVRVIAATNRQLKTAVDAGAFRADLYYRLSVFPLSIPPLRERSDDVVSLFEHFVARACQRLGRPFLAVSGDDAKKLERYAWPGNVRELENVAERAVILSLDGVLRLDDALPELAALEALEAPPASRELRDAPDAEAPTRGYFTADEMRAHERLNLVRALERAGGKIAGESGAAALLGVKPSTLAYQLKSFGIIKRS
ncbi:MAG: sigma 54-interacting transcriptional regulator [Labilithrix sp.]|nr:sigma 54-interacting transcriptional regulator [Labilithrix sp.]